MLVGSWANDRWAPRRGTRSAVASHRARRSYHGAVRRWLAVGLGGVTALGMQSLFTLIFGSALTSTSAAHYAALFGALVLGGYVAGHLVGRHHIFHGALAAVVYIFVTVTVNAIREAPVARQLGMGALEPINLIELTITDVVAMLGASCGGWLASRI
jgi:hypothetical protein